MRRIMKFWCAALALAFAMPAQAQWSDDPGENTQLIDELYWSNYVEYTPDGGFYVLGVAPDSSIHLVTPVLYYFDKNGVEVWDEPIKFSMDPATDSTLTYTKYMKNLYVDKQGNAIVSRQSLCEYQREKYMTWKISPEGKHLWPEDGVNLHNGVCPEEMLGGLQVTQLSDGTYVFGWFGNGIELQRVSADGQLLWGDGKKVVSGAYPYLIDAGDGDFLLVYQSAGFMVQRFDFNGEPVWAQPTVAYSGELPAMAPTWTYLQVVPTGDGVILGYPGFEGDEHYAKISYVKDDGTHAFSDADAGLRLGYGDNWGYEPALAYDAKNKWIYAFWIENRPGTSTIQRMVAQKVNTDGELLWDAEGVEILPLEQCAKGYPTVSVGPDNTVMLGYMSHGGVGISAGDPIDLRVSLLDKDGKFVWDEPRKFLSKAVSTKYSLKCSPYLNDQWIFFWGDCRVNGGVADVFPFAQNIYIDGSMGPDKPDIPDDTVAVEDMEMLVSSLQVVPNPVRGEARISYTSRQDENVRIDLVNQGGVTVANVFEGRVQAGENIMTWQRPAPVVPGMYLLQLTAGNRKSVTKIILQ